MPSVLISLWAQLGQVHRAEALARSFHEPSSRAFALSAVAVALAQADPGRANELAIEADQATAQIPDSVSRQMARHSLARDMARAGFWDIAGHTARSLTDPTDRADTLCALAKQAGESAELADTFASEALDTAMTITDSDDRDWTLRTVVEGLVAAGAWDRAESAALLTDPMSRKNALQAVVDGLVEAGRWDQAKRVARRIEDAQGRAKALAVVAAAAVRASRDLALALADEAEQTVREDPSFGYHPDTSQTLATVAMVAFHQNPSRARALAMELDARVRSGPALSHRIPEVPSVARAWAAIDPDYASTLAATVVPLAADLDQDARSRDLWLAVTELIAGGFWDPAEQAALAIPDPERQAWALQEVVEGLVRADEWVRAEQDLLAIKDHGPRTQSLLQLVKGLVLAGRWPQAQQAADALADPEERGQAYGTLVEGLIREGLIHDAERAARSMSGSGYRIALLLATVGTAIASTDRHRALSLAKEAEQAARTTGDSLSRDLAFAGAATALGAWDAPTARSLAAGAEQAARMLPDTREQALGLVGAAIALTRLEPARARELAAEAVELARRIPNHRDQAFALRTVSQDLFDGGLVDQAVQAAQAIWDSGDRAKALANAAAGLARSRRELAMSWATEAVRTAAAVTDPYQQAQVLRFVAGRLTRAGLADHAGQAALAIKDPDERAQALSGALVAATVDQQERARTRPTLAAALIEAVLEHAAEAFYDHGPTQELSAVAEALPGADREPSRAAVAERVARAVRDPADRALVLSAVATALSTAHPSRSRQLAAEAVQTARSIQDRREQSRALSTVAAALAAAGYWDLSQSAALAISDRYDRAQAFRELIAGLVVDRRWHEAMTAARTAEDADGPISVADDLVADLAVAHRWDQAEEATQIITDSDIRALTCSMLLTELMPTGPDTASQDQLTVDGAQRGRAGRLAAIVLASSQWPRAIGPVGLLNPAYAAAIADALVRAPGG
jgi:hypothetical protein